MAEIAMPAQANGGVAAPVRRQLGGAHEAAMGDAADDAGRAGERRLDLTPDVAAPVARSAAVGR